MTIDELQAKRRRESAQNFMQKTQPFDSPGQKQALDSIRGAFGGESLGLEKQVQNRSVSAVLPKDSEKQLQPVEDNSYNNDVMDQQKLLMMQEAVRRGLSHLPKR